MPYPPTGGTRKTTTIALSDACTTVRCALPPSVVELERLCLYYPSHGAFASSFPLFAFKSFATDNFAPSPPLRPWVGPHALVTPFISNSSSIHHHAHHHPSAPRAQAPRPRVDSQFSLPAKTVRVSCVAPPSPPPLNPISPLSTLFAASLYSVVQEEQMNGEER